MQRFETTPLSLLRSIASHTNLIGRLVVRDYQTRFRGSVLGLVWAIVTPLLTAGVYTFVFSAVFAARWGATVGGTFDFAVIFMLGLAIHTIFAEVVTRAPTLMLSNGSYVTKIVFPLELLPIITLISALVTAGISLAIVLVLQLVLNGRISPTLPFLPVVIAPYLIFVLALGLLLAAIGVYLRDISQLVGMLVTVTMFLSPIFYPVEAVPPRFRSWMWLNPLTFIIEQARGVALFGEWPDFAGLMAYTVCAAALLWMSYWLFQRLRVGFADVL